MVMRGETGTLQPEIQKSYTCLPQVFTLTYVLNRIWVIGTLITLCILVDGGRRVAYFRMSQKLLIKRELGIYVPL